MQPLETLSVKAADLARAAPQQWRDFLKTLADYSDHHRDQLVSSPVEGIQVRQGQAQALRSLCSDLGKCIETAEKIARKAPQ